MVATSHTGDDSAFNHNWSAGKSEAEFIVGDSLIPYDLTGAGVERHDMSVRGIYEDLVIVDCQVAHHRKKLRRSFQFFLVFPDKVAGGCVQGLNHSARIWQIHHA